MGNKVLVLGEIQYGELRNVSYEAIAAAKQVANGGEVVGLLLGGKVKHLANSLIYYGANRVITVEDIQLHSYTPDAYSLAVLQVINAEQPNAVILGHTDFGKDLSPRIADKLKTGLISDVVKIEEYDFIRTIYSGKAFEKITVNQGLFIATIRPNTITQLDKEESRSGEVIAMNLVSKDLGTIIKEAILKTTGVILNF